ncbi:MAG: GNAT family N-acetyltransferase [Eisenbergiella sp.]
MTASQLLLRPLTEDDIPTIFSLTSDPEVARFMRFSTRKHTGGGRLIPGIYVSR